MVPTLAISVPPAATAVRNWRAQLRTLSLPFGRRQEVPIHVGDWDDDYLEVSARDPVILGSGGNPNTASRPGFRNEVTRLIPRSVTVSTQTP